jgi:hypothetical protein
VVNPDDVVLLIFLAFGLLRLSYVVWGRLQAGDLLLDLGESASSGQAPGGQLRPLYIVLFLWLVTHRRWIHPANGPLIIGSLVIWLAPFLGKPPAQLRSRGMVDGLAFIPWSRVRSYRFTDAGIHIDLRLRYRRWLGGPAMTTLHCPPRLIPNIERILVDHVSTIALDDEPHRRIRRAR